MHLSDGAERSGKLNTLVDHWAVSNEIVCELFKFVLMIESCHAGISQLIASFHRIVALGGRPGQKGPL